MNKADFRILIVEDEVLIAEHIKHILKSFGFTSIDMAHHSEQALLKLKTGQYNVALLDVHLETEKAGIYLGDYLHRKSNTHFIYITAYSDLHLIQEIIQTEPIGYLNKPIKQAELFALLSLEIFKQEQTVATCTSQIHIIHDKKKLFIPTESILYIQGEGNYLKIYCTNNKEYKIRETMASFMENNHPLDLAIIHRSYIVNINKITGLDKNSIYINQLQLPLSRNYKDEIELKLNQK